MIHSAELLAALRAQDPAVAAPLWRCFAPTIARLLRRTLGPQARIDDAVQVALLCVFRRGRRMRPGADLRQSVLAVTARIAEGELRRTPGTRASRPPAVRASDAVTRFYKILDSLRAPDRVAFVFHYLEGMDVREVAVVTGASPARASRRLRRSLAKVVEAVDGDPALRRYGARAAAL